MARYKNIAEQYISQVLNGRVNVCKYVTLAVQRHIDNLDTGRDRGLFFVPSEGEKAIRFFGHIRQSKGEQFTGKPLILQPWQAFVVYMIYGWKKVSAIRPGGLRRFMYAYIEVPKKNGKTTLAAAIALKHLKWDGESRPEVYTVAKDRGQARISFDDAKSMVMVSPDIRKHLTPWAHSITCEANGGYMMPLSKDSEKKEGMGASCVINDEYHLQTDNLTFENLKSGMLARLQPLMFTITTAGFNIESPCFDERKTCIDILEGRLEQDNKFAIIYTIDEGDNWEDEKVWEKANPNLGVSFTIDKLRGEYQDAVNTPTKIPSFLTKHLCIWTRQSETWIKDEDWMRCNFGKVYPEKLKGRECIAALDLASAKDLNALCLLFPEGIYGVPDLLYYFWIPEKKVREKEDKVNYLKWLNEGYISIAGDEVVDIEDQATEIISIIQQFRMYKIQQEKEYYDSFFCDPFKMNDRLGQLLQAAGIKMLGFRQGWRSMDPACRELERLIIARKINHGGNPVLRWMNGNVALWRDKAGNIQIDKSKSTEKVDGMVATAMAVGGLMLLQSQQQSSINEIYKDRGIQTL